jgi:predicted GNAT family acetyltransferase
MFLGNKTTRLKTARTLNLPPPSMRSHPCCNAGYNYKKENNMQKNEINVTHNTEHRSFEAHLDSYTAELNYHLVGNTIVFTHTGVPTALEGRGIGSALVKTGLEYAKSNNLKVRALCWFVDGYIQRHPEYQWLIK